MYTACLIIIGNEILSGRTQDKNLAWIANELNIIGIRLMEVRVIPDIEAEIIATVNTCCARFTYVFTTGGIGPTHDDITSACVAKAFGVELHRHPEAAQILEKHYGAEQLNEARLKMADVPLGASLIANPVSAAPGFCMENVYVLAGVPRIMQAMFDNLKSGLAGGSKMLSHTVSVLLTEGSIAHVLGDLQNKYKEVELGSYPFIRQEKLGTSLVMRSQQQEHIDAMRAELVAALTALNGAIIEDEPAA